MATTDTPAFPGSGPPDGPGPLPEGPSPLAGEPRTARRRFTPAVALGAAAALLAGVVLARSTMGADGGGSEPGDVGTSGPPTVTPMIADPLPDGFEVGSVSPETGPDPAPPSTGPVDTRIYGDVTATAITNDVVVTVEATEPDTHGGTPLGEEVTVRGRQGLLCSPGPNQCDFGNNVTGVSWTEPTGEHISVESRTFDRSQLLVIAEGLTVDGTTVELGDVPAGVTKPPEVAKLHAAKDDAYSVEYWRPAGGPVYVSTRAEDEATRIYNLWLSGPRDDTVQGRPAAIEDIDGAYVVTWSPAPGQLVEILANGLDEAAARSFAESVRPATEAEWADLQEEAAARPPEEGAATDRPTRDDGDPGTEPPPTSSTPDPTLGMDPLPGNAVHRQLAGGAEVWGWLDGQRRLCYRTAESDGSASELCSPAEVLGVSPSGDGSGPPGWEVPAAVGVAPDGAASIEGGETTFGEQVDGGRLFVWEFSDGEMPDTLTFLDADGDEIATVEVIVI